MPSKVSSSVSGGKISSSTVCKLAKTLNFYKLQISFLYLFSILAQEHNNEK